MQLVSYWLVAAQAVCISVNCVLLILFLAYLTNIVYNFLAAGTASNIVTYIARYVILTVVIIIISFCLFVLNYTGTNKCDNPCCFPVEMWRFQY
jgi:hypothetical protein